MENNQDHLNLLRKIKNNPESSQRELAEELGFSLGKLNYCLKALKFKGLIKINNFIIREFSNHSIPLLKIYYCTDHPNKASINRKPGEGMFLSANKDFDINLSNCLMIGDSFSDMEPAFKLGMDSMLVMTGNGKVDKNCFEKDSSPTFFAKNILKGAKLLVK